MGRKKAKPNYRRIVLRLPDLDLGTVPLLTAVLTFGGRHVSITDWRSGPLESFVRKPVP